MKLFGVFLKIVYSLFLLFIIHSQFSVQDFLLLHGATMIPMKRREKSDEALENHCQFDFFYKHQNKSVYS
jgi:hypothetical protein